MRWGARRPQRRRNNKKKGFMIPFGDIILPFVGVIAVCLLIVATKFFFVNWFGSPRAASNPVEPVPVVADTALEGYPSRPSFVSQPEHQNAPAPAQAAETPARDKQTSGGGTVTVEVTATPVADEPYFDPAPGLAAESVPDDEPKVPAPRKNPAPQKTAPAAPKAPAKPQQQSSWRVQVGAYGSKQAAGDIVKKLAKAGYSATVFSGPKFHKVWVQAGATKDAAEKTAARLKKLGYPGSYIVPPAAK